MSDSSPSDARRQSARDAFDEARREMLRQFQRLALTSGQEAATEIPGTLSAMVQILDRERKNAGR